MLPPQTLKDSHSATSLQASGDGALPCASQVCQTPSAAGLVHHRASRSAQQGSSLDNSTHDISPQPSCASSLSAALQSSLENRLRQQLQSTGSMIYSLSWKQKLTPAGRRYCQRVASVHRTNAIDFFGAALLEHAGSFGRESWGIGHNAGYDGQQPVTACKNSRMADNWMQQRQSTMPGSRTEGLEPRGWDEATAETAGCGRRCSVAYCDSKQCNGTGKSGASGERKSADCGSGCGLAYLDGKRSQGQRAECASQGRKEQDVRQAGLCDRAGADAARQVAGFWSGADWLLCRDGKFRPVESGTFPLVNGFPGRVGRLRGYGNAIVPQVAAEFIISFLAAMSEVAQ